MKRKNILPREPFRGGQICGEQLPYGFCGYRKAHGEFFCRVHARRYRLQHDQPRMADGNALGSRTEPLRLSFEPWEGTEPVPPTGEEFLDWASNQTLRVMVEATS